MKNKILVTVIFISLLISCKSTTKLVKHNVLLDQEIIVLNINQDAPIDSKILKEIKLGYGLLYKNCDYNSIINKARFEAKKIGGNMIKITESKPLEDILVFDESCYKIKADILKVKDLSKYKLTNHIDEQSKNDFASLCIYRHISRSGSLLQYNLFLGDSLITRVKSNFKKTIKINKEGIYNLRTEKDSIGIPIDISLGENYYIKCSLKGKFVGSAKLVMKLMNEEEGKMEFESFIAKNN
ncbi:MAG TPA: hypothetical protein DDZ39_06795 [Flavobacteriaceae bacterium]|jgi:hypothetical protein|nr:hypothetical protein [Flavobacteriaceae bacterium]